MLSGPIKIENNAVHTRYDSYPLETIKISSGRPPLRGAGILIAGVNGGFAIAFADILWMGELLGISLVCTISLIGGFSISQLRFESRELRGSQLGGVVWGTVGHLNRVRRDIVAAQDAMMKRNAS